MRPPPKPASPDAADRGTEPASQPADDGDSATDPSQPGEWPPTEPEGIPPDDPAGPRPRAAPVRPEARVKVLVTGGAGYVGGVSVDAILAAGHDVVVLDDLTTGHAAAVSPEATPRHWLVRATRPRSAPCSRRRGSTPSSTAPPARSSARACATRPATTGTTSPAASRCSRRRARRASTGSCSRRPPRSTASRTAPRSTRTTPPPDQHLRRDEAHVRGRAALVRRGVRVPERRPALLQRRRARARASARSTARRRTSSRTCSRQPRAARR